MYITAVIFIFIIILFVNDIRKKGLEDQRLVLQCQIQKEKQTATFLFSH